MLVKNEDPGSKNSLAYQPCDPTETVPDYDEVVVFNKGTYYLLALGGKRPFFVAILMHF